MGNQDTPEFSWPFEYGCRFIVPSKVLSAVAAEGQAPTVAWKPGVDEGGPSMSYCTRTVKKGEEITFHTRWVDKEMSMATAYGDQSIRRGDKTPTAAALVDFAAVATGSSQGKSKAEHAGFQSKEGLLAGK